MKRFIGLMSGTSVDGIDAVLLAVDGVLPDAVRWRPEAFRSSAFPEAHRRRILDALTGGTPATLTALHADLGEWFAGAVLALLDEAGLTGDAITAVGSHGQTIWHRPPAEGRRGATLQLGDPATLAARTGIDVVSDFRAADVAAGGEGAPLVPWPDRVLLSAPDRARLLLNVGGIANLTWLAPRRGPEGSGPVASSGEYSEGIVAFDTGPGNVLLDAAAERASGGAERFDRDGRRAAAGTVDPRLLAELCADPFFARPPPRSTGREHFSPGRVEALARRLGLGPDDASGWDDLLATLTALTAETAADAVARWVRPRPIDEVVVAGGGAHNPTLVRALDGALRRRDIVAPVRTGREALGIDPDAREAAAFALLAWAHLEGVPANVPAVTGAAGPRVLGSLTRAPGRARRGRPGPPEDGTPSGGPAHGLHGEPSRDPDDGVRP